MHLRNWRSQTLQIWCKGWMCKSQPTDDKLSLIGAWSGHVSHITKFWGYNHITGTAEPKVVKFCTRVGNINSMQQDDISPTKGRAHGHVTVLKFCRKSWCSATCGFVSEAELYLLIVAGVKVSNHFSFIAVVCHCHTWPKKYSCCSSRNYLQATILSCVHCLL